MFLSSWDTEEINGTNVPSCSGDVVAVAGSLTQEQHYFILWFSRARMTVETYEEPAPADDNTGEGEEA